MGKEYIKNHYIPQFILKNFSFNNTNDITYYDKKTKEIIITKTSNVFVIDNLYRDNINYPEIPTQIEQDLSRYECEIARLINNKFLKDNEIIITKDEENTLKLFLAIMSYRSIHSYETLCNHLSNEFREIYLEWQPNGDFNDFWKRNLGYLANCRNINEVMAHDKIDEPIKRYMFRDTETDYGMYVVVSEVRGKSTYVIGDSYPTMITGETETEPSLHLYSLYPISPTRMIILATEGVLGTPQKFLDFDKKILTKPYIDSDNNIHINVKRMYQNDVDNVNSLTIQYSKYGYIFK